MHTGDWLAIAKSLPEGHRVRIVHSVGCSTDKKLLIENSARGYRAYCFKCNESFFSSKVLRAADLRKAGRVIPAQGTEFAGLGDILPASQLEVWPSAAKVWLYKAGLTNQDIIDMGAVYSVSRGRVVVTNYLMGKLNFWQARAVDGREPKYISAKGPASERCVRWARPGADVVITEDMLSAYKAYLAGYTGLALIGTSVTAGVLRYLRGIQADVYVWLDDDAPGRAAVAAALKKVSMVSSAEVRFVFYREPKLCSKIDLVTAIRESSVRFNSN